MFFHQSWLLRAAVLGWCLTLVLGWSEPAGAQTMAELTRTLFTTFTEEDLVEGPGPHGEHFKLQNNATSAEVVDAFSNLVAANVSSFPLSSTVSGVTFDFTSGVPVATSTSLGPIFAERASTLGRGRLNIGANVSVLNLTSFRGVPTEDLRFGLTHQDLAGGGMGNQYSEFDVLNLGLDMDLKANIFAVAATYGVTDVLDVGIAVPFVTVNLDARLNAAFDSFTLLRYGQPLHHFGEGRLAASRTLSGSSSGIGDIALRAKYHFYDDGSTQVGAFLDARLPSGDAEQFLGSGETNVRAQALFSWERGDFHPHVNAGFEYRGADSDANELEVIAGFDQKVHGNWTFAADFIGEWEVESRGDLIDLPGRTVISGVGGGFDRDPQNPDPLNEPLPSRFEKIVDHTNIPDIADDFLNTSVGFKWAPAEDWVFFGNAIVSMNQGGLRADFVPTFGFSKNF